MTDTAATPKSSRERILEAAIHLFAYQGYENTSTLSIARAAHTSETQLVKNFNNKEGLLQAACDQVVIELAGIVPEVQHISGPREKLREFFNRALRMLDDNPEYKMILLLDTRRVRRKTGGAVLVPPAAPAFLNLIDGILDEARVAGQLKPGLRSQLIRSAIFGAVGELLRDPLAAEDSVTGSVTTEEVQEVLDHMLSCFFVS